MFEACGLEKGGEGVFDRVAEEESVALEVEDWGWDVDCVVADCYLFHFDAGDLFLSIFGLQDKTSSPLLRLSAMVVGQTSSRAVSSWSQV